MPTEHCFQRNALQGEVCYFCAENELKIRLNDFVKKVQTTPRRMPGGAALFV